MALRSQHQSPRVYVFTITLLKVTRIPSPMRLSFSASSSLRMIPSRRTLKIAEGAGGVRQDECLIDQRISCRLFCAKDDDLGKLHIYIDQAHSSGLARGRDLGAEAPVPIHVFKRSESGHEEQSQIYRVKFWNYFSMGMDGHVAYRFHTMRQENPENFKNQLNNQLAYGKLGCSQGWFFASCWHALSRNINELATIYMAERDGPWKELKLSSSIRSFVMLNLPSFSGGLNPWGKPSERKSAKRGLQIPSVNDGLLELVGFRDAWHGLSTLLPHGHGTRLAQAHKVKIVLKAASKPKQTYMHIDGEPWAQPLPEQEHGTEIEVCHYGQCVLLAKKGCIAENRDAYQHVISFTKHGIEHGLHFKPVPPHKMRDG